MHVYCISLQLWAYTSLDYHRQRSSPKSARLR